MISDALWFEFDGIKSKDKRLMNVTMSGGMQEEYFAAGKKIYEDQIRGRSKPYFQGTTREPLKFSVSFSFLDTWDDALLREVRRWLTEPTDYRPLIFSNDLEKIYYAICIDDPVLVHNGLQQGYIKLNFRCNDAYAYSPIMTSKLYDWHESILTKVENDFSNGTHNGTVLSSQQLTLTSVPKRWVDISPTVSWNQV